MAEIVASFLGPAIEVVRWVAAPIKRQFNYLCCFTTNINSLKDEAKKLDDEVGELQGQVDRERDNLLDIVPRVETWLTNSNHIKDEVNGILDEVPNIESGCLKLGARFSLSKRAKKITDRMKELRGQKNFDHISHPGPPAATQAIPLGKTYEFESRKKFEEDIMTILRGGDVNIIGICGMGGLGKTTMAKRIMNRVLKEHVLQEVVMAVVSQQVDESKIQIEIGRSLGLDLKEETSQARAQKLHARLSGGAKRILVVLDDVWEGVELEALGIPCDSKGCTILLTSRNTDALHAMSVQRVFGMEVLSEEEAWFLFRERVGTCVDDTKLMSIAEQVVKECSGLPIALTTVGAALRDEKNVRIWKDALGQLRQSDRDVPDFIAKVYNPLKVSYDFLSSKQAKSLFLLCCLFPEDDDIDVEKLTCFSMGLGIFEGIINLEGGRNRMSRLIKMLKSRSLLLDGRNEKYVRMHDVVRDVCTFIAKEEGYIGGNDCTWISSSHLPIGLGFPNLRLLFLSRNYGSLVEEEFKLYSAILEGIRDLSVLCIEYYSLTLLRHTTQSLKNLSTLLLYSCWELKTISIVGELVNLEILICHGCIWIEELPEEIKGLNRLKLLDLTDCYNLQRIGRGILSSLVGLEELKIKNSFRKWEAEDREERENAGLRELEALTNLRWLEIDIDDHALAAENMHLSSKIDRFQIRFGNDGSYDFIEDGLDKVLHLPLYGETCLGDWIEMQLLRDTQYLHLTGNGANNVDLAKCRNIRWLKLGDCETMKNIVRMSGVDVFPSLDRLNLSSLPKLEQICDGPISSNSFQNLSSIYLRKCPRLRNLGQLSIAGKDGLSRLQNLYILECEMMEQVFLWNKVDEKTKNSESRNPRMITKMFPELKMVYLRSLPNLTTFYHGIEGIKFPLLSEISIEYCPKMTSIVSIVGMGSNGSNSGGSSNAGIHHFFCQSQKVSFGNLKKLDLNWNPFCGHKILVSSFNGLEQFSISEYHGSMSLSSSIAKNLVNLERLHISECDEIVQVIKDDEEEKMASGGQRTILFPELQELSLWNLPKLATFCECKCDVELPSLRKLDITGCSTMRNFTLGFVAAPNLEAFTTDFNNDLEVKGVNVSFDKLKKLSITEIEYPFNHHKISMSALINGLKELRIWLYEGSMNLFTSSITGNLFNLRVLEISWCYEMVKVIEDKEEKVVSSGGERTLLFPKLEELKLEYLPKLVSFCEWKCDIELPSLRQVVIHECPNMKSFSLGPLTTPNLKIVQIDYAKIGAEKDLNGALQQHYLALPKKMQEEEEIEDNDYDDGDDDKKEAAGEEDQEIKGEIEEEKN